MGNEPREIVDAIAALVWTMRPDGDAEFVNERWREYTGLSLEAARGAGWQAAIASADRERVLDFSRARQDNGEAGSIEARLRSVGGTDRWFRMHCSPMRDASGAIANWCWCAAHADVEKQEHMEAVLAGEKQLLEMVATGRPLPTILEALCLTVEGVAPGCHCSITLLGAFGTLQTGAGPSLPAGYIGAINGLPVSPDTGPCAMAMALNVQVIVPDIATDTRWDAGQWPALALAHRLRSCWSTPILSLAGTVLGSFALYQEEPGGPTEVQRALIEQFTHVACIAIERAQEEAALRRSEAFLAEAQRLSATGSVVWDLTTGRTTWSDQTYRIFDIARGTRVTRDLIAGRIHPDDVGVFEAAVARAEGGEERLEFECRLLLPDGSVKYLLTIGHTVRDAQGHLECIGAVQDVTERRNAEATLDRLRTELAHVARVTTLGVLTASIAHEVNQPLAGIMTNASTCLGMLSADPPNVEGARETARRTIRDAQRGADVIARLRALFGKNGAATELVDLNEATREVLALSGSELQRARVSVRAELAEELPCVSGDRVQLQQVVLNLLLNGAEAMGDVEDRPRRLVIRTSVEDGERVRLSVEDAGVGVDPATVERLFEAFYTTKGGGMGIGLSVSRSIVARHHGRLWAAPNDGPGATFAFALPAVRRAGVP